MALDATRRVIKIIASAPVPRSRSVRSAAERTQQRERKSHGRSHACNILECRGLPPLLACELQARSSQARQVRRGGQASPNKKREQNSRTSQGEPYPRRTAPLFIPFRPRRI